MGLADLLELDCFTSSVIRDLLVHARQPNLISLAGGLPSETTLPVERVSVGLQSLLRERGTEVLQYGLTTGEPELQEKLAATSPHPSSSDRIVVTAGSQQALDLVLRVLVSQDPSKNVAVIEDPGYLGAIQALVANRFTLAPIPVDHHGLDVEKLDAQLHDGLRPRLCYINPSFQNPTGALLATDRAQHLVRLAEQYNFVILADDPYIELYLEGDRPRPLPPSELVVRLGSVSKTLSPGLRVGWLDAEPHLAAAVALAKQPADLQTSTLSQLLVADLLNDGNWWRTHTEALRSDYRLRRSKLSEALRTHLPEVQVNPGSGGFFLWLTLDQAGAALDTMEVLEDAITAGVAYVPGDAFTVQKRRPNTLRLSYSSGDPDQFGEAVHRLAEVLNPPDSKPNRP